MHTRPRVDETTIAAHDERQVRRVDRSAVQVFDRPPPLALGFEGLGAPQTFRCNPSLVRVGREVRRVHAARAEQIAFAAEMLAAQPAERFAVPDLDRVFVAHIAETEVGFGAV